MLKAAKFEKTKNVTREITENTKKTDCLFETADVDCGTNSTKQQHTSYQKHLQFVRSFYSTFAIVSIVAQGSASGLYYRSPKISDGPVIHSMLSRTVVSDTFP